MSYNVRILVLSFALGLGAAGLLQVIALLANQVGLHAVAALIDWPNALLQASMPCQPGSGCEPGAMNPKVYFASLPLGAAAYAVIARSVLRRKLPPEG